MKAKVEYFAIIARPATNAKAGHQLAEREIARWKNSAIHGHSITNR